MGNIIQIQDVFKIKGRLVSQVLINQYFHQKVKEVLLRVLTRTKCETTPRMMFIQVPARTKQLDLKTSYTAHNC